jgi:hypothetical protein
MMTRDRRAALLAPPGNRRFNGIDFVEVANDAQTTLVVHFLNAVPVQSTLTGTPKITGGETIPDVIVDPILGPDWGHNDRHVTLTLRVPTPGDFSFYTLAIPSPVLDPFFDHATFSFKARCPSDLDCRPPPVICPPVETETPPIDYLAKDFLSFRQALLDFSALRYPNWQERSEADFGIVFLEALSAVADELSYTQDRVAAEAALVTATQRRSAVRHARLVDYEPTPAVCASVMLQFDVGPNVTAIPDGVRASAQGPDGRPIVFEMGSTLAARIDPATGQLGAHRPTTPASPLWNAGRIRPYWLDESERCLTRGATAMYVRGHGYGFQPGQALLIDTSGESSADPPIRQIVHLIDANEECDELFLRDVTSDGPPWLTCPVSPPQGQAPTAITRIIWETSDALKQDHDLGRTLLSGNIVMATQGFTVTNETFVASPAPGDASAPTIARTGPRPTLPDGRPGIPVPQHQYTLASSGTEGSLAWLPLPAVREANGLPALGPVPEILLLQHAQAGPARPWTWFRRLLDAGASDAGFTLDSARYQTIARNSNGSVQCEYDGSHGDTIRFGDGNFGLIPANGTRFTASYRIGAGAAGNVSAGAVNRVDPRDAASDGHLRTSPPEPRGRPRELLAVTNPLAATGGTDPEPLERVRRLAPQAFRAELFRAVIPADYEAAAETLSWVERAGTAFRWSGSWLTVFTTPEPRATEIPTTDQRTGLIDLLNRWRMAGYESYVPDPRYVSIDLVIELCATAEAYRGDVEQAVLAALAPTSGFFTHGNFTFSEPLERSRLEAAIQTVPGVAGVLCIRYRLRNRSADFAELPGSVAVATDEIIRCDNDPRAPERGTLRITVLGGK